ncbi:hypothetical protein G7Z17_g116 [Cylindrodendrum hubeiense]|uniref:Uncharacterized protein n=1 Tax=Cylindrodendrum hubeiense TaxID=595255 RepID=A0A9P5HHN8_9HYPO|nr:hypothetical protein G7Z17_g116 [Cylindrodendrum hubeiense]
MEPEPGYPPFRGHATARVMNAAQPFRRPPPATHRVERRHGRARSADSALTRIEGPQSGDRVREVVYEHWSRDRGERDRERERERDTEWEDVEVEYRERGDNFHSEDETDYEEDDVDEYEDIQPSDSASAAYVHRRQSRPYARRPSPPSGPRRERPPLVQLREGSPEVRFRERPPPERILREEVGTNARRASTRPGSARRPSRSSRYPNPPSVIREHPRASPPPGPPPRNRRFSRAPGFRPDFFDDDDEPVRLHRRDSHRSATRHRNVVIPFSRPRPGHSIHHRDSVAHDYPQPIPEHQYPPASANPYVIPVMPGSRRYPQRPPSSMPPPPPPDMIYGGSAVPPFQVYGESASMPYGATMVSQYPPGGPNPYLHQQHMPMPPPPEPAPAPAPGATIAEERERERERAEKAAIEEKRQKEFYTLRRDIDESMKQATQAQLEQLQMTERFAKTERENRQKFEELIQREFEQSISKASEMQKKRQEKTEKWARAELDKLKSFEELIKKDIESTLQVVKTLQAEQAARDEQAEKFRSLMEEQSRQAMEALDEADRLRNELDAIQARHAGATEGPPPMPPPFRPGRARRGSYHRPSSPAPSGSTTSPPPPAPEPPGMNSVIIDESEEDEEGGDEDDVSNHRKEYEYSRPYSPRGSSVASYDSYTSVYSRSGRPRKEKERELRRSVRMLREELLDPIIDSISALATAVMFGGLHFQSPPVFMHYPPAAHRSDTSRSVSEGSISDDKETVTQQQNEQPRQSDESTQKHKLPSQSQVVVSTPDHNDQDTASTRTTDSGMSNDEVISPGNGSVVAESWTTATEEATSTYNSAEDVQPKEPVIKEQGVFRENAKDEDAEETPTLVNSEFTSHTVIEKRSPVQEPDNVPGIGGEKGLDAKDQAPTTIIQQNICNEAIESHPNNSSDTKSGKELLGPVNHKAEGVDLDGVNPQPSTSDKRSKQEKAADSRHRYWDGSYIPKGKAGGRGKNGRNPREKASPSPVLQHTFIPIPYFHPVFGGVPPARNRRRRGGDEGATVD